jgi:hypothetical protein
MSTKSDDTSPDGGDRIRDFWDRHGGPGVRPKNAGETVPGISGWSEVYAADGYILRCDWSQSGDRKQMHFTEKAP